MLRRSSRPTVSLVAVTAAVTALLVNGTAAAGSAAAATPTAPGAFVGLPPARVLDTRSGVGAPPAPVTPGQAVHLTVAGAGGVPATGVSAVVLTLTVTNTGAGGYLSAYPTGTAAPTASVLNWATGQTLAGQATVTVGTGGQVDLLVQAGRPVDLVADVSGYIVSGTPTAAGAYVPRTPTRLLDTRTGNGARPARVQSGQTVHVALAGRGGLPAASQVSAVVATLTVVRPGTAGYLSAWPGGTRPDVSALNFAAGQTVANQVTVPLGTDGAIDVFAQGGPLDAVLDVTGYVLAGTATEPGTYVPLAPSRVLDTRRTGNPRAREVVPEQVSGLGGVPVTGVSAVVANLTVTNTTSSGYLAATPFDVPGSGATSNLNWATGRTVANQATVALGDAGRIGLFIGAGTSPTVVIDVFGYYLPAPPPTPGDVTATPDRTSVYLQWSSPAGVHEDFTIRRAVGTTPPASPVDGTAVVRDILGTPGRFHLTDTGLTTSTTYSYAVFASDPVPNTSAPGTVTTTTLPPDTTPPGPDTGLTATAQVTSVTLRWTPPVDADYRDTVVRRTVGTTPPTSPTDGVAAGTGSYTNAAFVAGLTSATTYSFAVFARDDSGNVAPTGPTTTITTIGTTGVTGTTTPLPPAAFDPQKGALDQDCPPVGHCVALSWYFDETAERHGLLMITVVRDTGPVSYPVPLPSTVASRTEPTGAVSCVSDTECEIVGRYTDDDQSPVAFTAHWDGSTATSAVLPSGGADAVDPDAVDCPSSGVCDAVGGLLAASGEQPWAARLTDGVWQEVPVDASSTAFTARLVSVTCATATSCVAAGYVDPFGGSPALLATTTTGTAWTAVTITTPAGATGWTAVGPAVCPAAGTCFAAGRYVLPGSPTRYPAALLTWRAGRWTTEALPGVPSTSTSDPAQIACGGGRCSVLIGNGAASTVYSRPLAGGAWTGANASVLPAGGTSTSPGLAGIACDAIGRCAGTGAWADANGYWRGFVAAFSSSQNSATSVEPSVHAALGGTNLSAPECTDDGNCIATADYLADTENSWIASFRIVGG